LTPVFEIGKVAVGNCFAGFDLHGHDFFSVYQQAINFFAGTVLPII